MRRGISLFALALALLVLPVCGAQAARSNIEAGDGLIRVKSAKIGAGFPVLFRSTAFVNRMDIPLGPNSSQGKDTWDQVWTYEGISIPIKQRAEVLVSFSQHAKRIHYGPGTNQQGGLSNTVANYGVVGDGLFALKLKVPLPTDKIDLALQPMFSIPSVSDSIKVKDFPSQSGGMDFGGKFLVDANLSKVTLYLNGGFMSRAHQTGQLMTWGGVEYGPLPYVSAFLEGGGTVRTNAYHDLQKIPDWQASYFSDEQFNSSHLTPGFRINVKEYASLDLAADFGLSYFDPKWQVALGLSVPSVTKARARIPKKLREGVIAGRITEKGTGKPIEALVSFPASDLASLHTDKQTGEFSISAPPGEYLVKVSAEGYKPREQSVSLSPSGKDRVDLTLAKEAPPLGTLVGKVIDALSQQPVVAALALPYAEGEKVVSDPSTGNFMVKLPAGAYTGTITSDVANYLPEGISFDVKSGEVSNIATALVKRGERIILRGISLLGGQAVIGAENYETLDRIGGILESHPGLRLEIGGHVASQGTVNKQVESTRRLAEAVKTYLTGRLQISPDRLFVNAYGSSNPLVSNRTREGRLQNQRVELLILGQGEKVPEANIAITPIPVPGATTTPTPKPTPTPTPKPAETGDAQAFYRAGLDAYFNDNYDKAIANFERAVKLDPGNSKARDYLTKARAKASKLRGTK